MMRDNGGNKKAVGKNGPLRLHKVIIQKILTKTIFLLASATNMLSTSRFLLGCMKWQHAVILESTCASNLIMTFLPA